MCLITISTAFHVMQNIIERNGVMKQPNKTKDVLISMCFRQIRFLKTRYFKPYARQIFIAVRQKFQCMLENLRACHMEKKSPALHVSPSQRVSFCVISIHLNLSKTVKTDKPNLYIHTLFFYYILLHYLVSTQTEEIVTTIRLDISLMQLLVCLYVRMVQSYFTCTKYF